ncbi:P-type conjugative transfer protein VirB9 [Salmonella enterica]|nr:P-type conjugative transfer protein VirB9 [Salmonella enterica]
MKKMTLTLAALFLCGTGVVSAAALPQGSSYDSRMQQVSYNSRNTTVVHAAEGYVSTLVFADDEDVISTQTGFIKGWNVTKEGNRVYIRVAPVKQPVKTVKSGEDGDETVETEQVFQPEDKGWRTNLFVTTTKHFYSLELRLIDNGKPLDKLAYVVSYQYPQEARRKAEVALAERQRELEQKRLQTTMQREFENAQSPRNWSYFMRVGKDSRDITPDIAYDDGRFTYLGFSPLKKFPAVFSVNSGNEQIVQSTVQQKGNFKMLVIQQVNPRFVLRAGDKVVGIENQGYGKVIVGDGSTVSPKVERVEVE